MRLHPLSAVRDALSRALAIGSTVLFIGFVGASAFDAFDVRLVFVLAPAAALLGAAYGVAYYLRFDYALEPSTLAIRSGVFARREREIPLRRVQNVDLRQSVLQRALSLAQVRIETAGGGQTEAVIDFVSMAEAERLRREIRERKGDSPAVDDAVEDHRVTFRLGDVELGLYALASFRPSSVLLLVFALPVGWEAASGLLLRVAAPLGGPARLDVEVLASVAGLAIAVVGLVLAALTTWAVSALFTLVGYYGFTLGEAGEDLVYERGLLRRYSGSIPREKIQTLTVTEPLIARWLGYAGLRVETAGYARGGDRGGGANRPASAVPLATRERALALARSIEPFDDLEIERPPRVARRRYAVRYLLAVLVLTALAYGAGRLVGGLEYWPAPLLLLPLVPVAAHLKWANRGYHLGADHVALRSGFWRRRTRVVPYYRLQTVATRRSLFQRRLGLGSVVADTASSGSLLDGAAVAHDVGLETARRLHDELRGRLQSAVGAGR